MRQFIFLIIIAAVVSCTAQTNPTPLTATHRSPSPTPLPELAQTETETPSPIPAIANSPVPTSTPTSSATKAAPTNTPSSTPLPALPTPLPTVESILSGPEISFQGIHFTIDPTLAEELKTQTGPGYNWDSPYLSTYFYFGEETLPCSQRGKIEIHPVQALIDLEGMGPHLPTIQERIHDPLSGDFPTWGAAILVQTPTQQRLLPGINGIQALVMHAQDLVFASNELLVYDFHGITTDGLYYIHICYPLDVPILMNDTIFYTGQPIDLSAQGHNNQVLLPPTIPGEWEDFAVAAHSYNEQVALALENLPLTSFSPDLTLLENLLESLQVKPTN